MQGPAIDTLNHLLRGELTAVETYTRALERVDDGAVTAQLQRCRASHLHRVEALHRKVLTLGGEPVRRIDAAGDDGDSAGVKRALEVLEAGEDAGRRDYRTALGMMDG